MTRLYNSTLRYFVSKLLSLWDFLAMERHAKAAEPLFTFGIVTDVQYSDRENGLNFEGSRMRYYRQSLTLLRNCVSCWTKPGKGSKQPDFVLQLGDLIDGYSQANGHREGDFKSLLDSFGSYKGYVCHLWGNHEFYSFSRSELFNSPLNSMKKAFSSFNGANCSQAGKLGNGSSVDCSSGMDSSVLNPDRPVVVPYSGEKEIYCFSFIPHRKFRFVCVDSYDISCIGRSVDSKEYSEAVKVLTKHNTNDNWNSPNGLPEPHYIKFNGGISEEQLVWLRTELEEATREKQHVFILSHIPFYPAATDGLCLVWNYREALEVIHQFDCVKACLCGHDHDGGFGIDGKGIHHYTFPAVLECKPGTTAFATAVVYEDEILIEGHGKVPSSCIKLTSV